MVNSVISRASLSSAVILFLCASHHIFANYAILSRNVVDLSQNLGDGALVKRANLTGITLGASKTSNAYFVATPDGFFERRSTNFHHIIWRTKLFAPSQGTWTLDQDRIFGGDTKGHFYSIDTENGKIIWKSETKGVFFSKPLVLNNVVFVATSHSTLQAYDRNTGMWLWQQSDPGTGALGLWSAQGPVLFQGHIVVGFPSATLVAFRPQDGQAVWNESFSDKIQGADTFNDLKSVNGTSEFLFASSFSGDLKAWTASQGSKKLLWQKRISLHAPITVDPEENTVYASARDGKLYAFDIQSGFMKWEYELPRGLGGQPTFTRDQVWVGTSAGQVFSLSKNGKLFAKSNDFQASIWNSPLQINDNEMAVITDSGLLRVLALVKISR